MASGSARIATGKFTATGALITVSMVGFRPQKVELIVTVGTKAGLNAAWHDTMADASAFKRVAAGTGSFVTTGGITPLAGGFSVGTDADMNNSGDTIHWVAHE